MNMKINIQEKDIAQLEPSLLAEGVNTLRTLAWAVDGDIYTDAPECQATVNQVQVILQNAYDVLERIDSALLKTHDERAAVQSQTLANHIKDEAVAALAAKSMAEELSELGIEPSPALWEDERSTG